MRETMQRSKEPASAILFAADGGWCEEEEKDELIQAGIDPEAMGYLPAASRMRILLMKGLNPKKFDF